MWKISDNLGREYSATEENNIFTVIKEKFSTGLNMLTL